MENNVTLDPLDSEGVVKIRLSDSERGRCYRSLRRKIIKLLYLIEQEQRKEIDSIDRWFYGLVFELSSSNTLCDNELTDVLVKIHGLYEQDKYKTMTHDQIKRQIMESKGILDFLIKQIDDGQ